MSNGFGDSNKGELILDLKSPYSVKFSDNSADKAGGLATPDLSVLALSRTFGTVNGNKESPNPLQNFSDGKFEPQEYFGFLDDAKLLGSIKLATILEVVPNILTSPEKVPVIINKNYRDKIETVIDWNPDVKNLDIGILKVEFKGITQDRKNDYLSLNVNIVESSLDPQNKPQITVHGKIEKFSISLFELVTIRFKSIEFTSKSGKKPETKVELDDELGTDEKPIEFSGALKFVDSLKDLIPFKGFKDGPFIELMPSGILIGYSLPLPNLAIGAFTLENIRLLSSFELPFGNEPIMFRFSFSERHDPFIITVSMLGGGGFFGVALGPKGIEIIEISMEFGAHASLTLAVASASLHMMAGIYLKIDQETENPPLTGFLRAYGCAEVLGLITASVEFYLGLTYDSDNSIITGEAVITVEVDMGLFEKEVDLRLTRTWSTKSNFALMGNPVEPKTSFSDLIKKEDWEDKYCEAFV